MTIREVESRCGMDRANIRFYEREGLLAAPRLSNGYRDYTEENVRTLLRIRLLRSLHVSLEDIRALQTGEKELPQTLRDQIGQLAREEADAAAAGRVCREIEAEHVSFSELDAPKYLSRLESGAAPLPAPQAESDRVPYPCCPVRRFFARELDRSLYCALSVGILSLCGVLLHEVRNLAAIVGIFSTALMVFLEPAFLHWFGTTPGKAILGLAVETEDGGRLSCGEGWSRVWRVLWQGCGLGIPVYALVRQYKCLDASLAGEAMPWDDGYVYIQRDRRPWRVPVYAAAAAGVLFVSCAVVFAQQLAPNRGALTAAQFAENYNYFDRYFYGESASALQPDGTWAQSGDAIIIYVIGEEQPQLHIETEDGLVRRVWFTYSPDPEYTLAGTGERQCFLTALSLAGAQEQAGLFSDVPDALQKAVSEGLKTGGMDTELYGVHLTAECESNGYDLTELYLVARDDVPQEQRRYCLTFCAEW